MKVEHVADTKRIRDKQHFEACRLAYERGFIDDDDMKIFVSWKYSWLAKDVVTRMVESTSVRVDEWTIEPSSKKTYDAWLDADKERRLLLLCHCPVLHNVIELKYPEDFQHPLPFVPSGSGHTSFYKLVPKRVYKSRRDRIERILK